MTADHGVDLDALTPDQRTALVEELFDDEKRKAVELAGTRGYEAGFEAGQEADGDLGHGTSGPATLQLTVAS